MQMIISADRCGEEHGSPPTLHVKETFVKNRGRLHCVKRASLVKDFGKVNGPDRDPIGKHTNLEHDCSID